MHFVELKREHDEPVWINVEQVRVLRASDRGLTLIVFEPDHHVLVKGTPAEVSKRLEA